MAVIVTTRDPQALLNAIYNAIDSRQVSTWKYDKDRDFIHTPEQWANKGWLRPTVREGKLYFGLLGSKGTSMKKIVYAVYHGRFIEMLLDHFDDRFTDATGTAAAQEGYDFFGQSK